MSIYTELSAAWLKNTYLLGVDLTLDDGTAYPDEIYTNSIQAAVAYLEHELGVILDTTSFVGEQHDAYEPNRSGFWPFRLDHRPVRSVEKMQIKLGAFPAVTIPNSWVQQVQPMYGQIHIIPSQEMLGSYIFRAGIPLIAGDVYQPAEYIPGYFHFDYTVGFGLESGTVSIAQGVSTSEVTLSSAFMDPQFTVTTSITDAQGASGASITSKAKTGFTISLAQAPTTGAATISWTASGLPQDIKHALGYLAAMQPLNVAGDLIAGAGVASFATSIDGLSTSLNTTSSATNSGYGARILNYLKQLKELLPALRAKYRTINIGVL